MELKRKYPKNNVLVFRFVNLLRFVLAQLCTLKGCNNDDDDNDGNSNMNKNKNNNNAYVKHRSKIQYGGFSRNFFS